MKALVAFYSRADENYFGGAYRSIEVGNTERAAREIAKETGADLFHIQQVQPYAAEYRTCVAQAREDFQTKARPAVKDLPENLDAYDEIYLGYQTTAVICQWQCIRFWRRFRGKERPFIHSARMKAADCVIPNAALHRFAPAPQ